MTVGFLLNNISSSELTEWMAYARIVNPKEKEAPSTGKTLKAMFAHRVKKKKE